MAPQLAAGVTDLIEERVRGMYCFASAKRAWIDSRRFVSEIGKCQRVCDESWDEDCQGSRCFLTVLVTTLIM